MRICSTEHVDTVKGSAKPSSSWKMIIFTLFGVIAVILCAVVGYIVYDKSRQASRKRFY